jgi:peptidoglycan hydrolase-like protein with peptidoglycan-binding domain
MLRQFATILGLLILTGSTAFAQNPSLPPGTQLPPEGRKFIERLFGHVVVPSAQSISTKPSFDCSRVTSVPAQIICTDLNGAAADWEVNSAGWARKGLLDETGQLAFDADESAWVKALSQECRLPSTMNAVSPVNRACVINAYRKRALQYRSQLTGDSLAESKLSPDQHVNIQTALLQAGYLTASVDGEFGRQTRESIKRYQHQAGAPETGFLSAAQVRALLFPSQGPSPRPPEVKPAQDAIAIPPVGQNETEAGLRRRLSEVEAALTSAQQQLAVRGTEVAEFARKLRETDATLKVTQQRLADANRRVAEAEAAKHGAEQDANAKSVGLNVTVLIAIIIIGVLFIVLFTRASAKPTNVRSAEPISAPQKNKDRPIKELDAEESHTTKQIQGLSDLLAKGMISEAEHASLKAGVVRGL